MKHLFTFPLAALLALSMSAQDGTHVLEHIPPAEATETPNYWGQVSQGVDLWGYYIGHNAWGDEEFGEKYEIPGHGDVVGVIAYFGGTANSTQTASLNLYAVAANGLPGNLIRSKSFVIGEVDTDGITPTMVTFDTDGHVDDEFFVTLSLGDYSHDPISDTLVLMMGPDGSRPASDDVFGRNVIRWHSHSTMNWKDFATQNFTPINTYFAIYPVMEGDAPLSAGSDFLKGIAPSFFPVPVVDQLSLRFEATESREMLVRLFAIDGKLLQTKRQMVVQGENQLQLDMNAYPNGAYVVSMEAGSFRYGRVISK